MLDIYICEDNLKQLDFIRQKIEDFITFDELDMEIALASDNPRKILEKAENAQNCGLYFLDIDLQDSTINGFTLAQSIRKLEPRCFIVFITSHIELSFYTFQYKVEALDFIIKDTPERMKTKIHECILNAYEKYIGGLNIYKNIFTISPPNAKQISINFEDILYFETSTITHRIILHAKQRLIEFPDQLNSIEKRLNKDFLRCHRSIIVNINHIEDINYQDCIITLSDGSTCPLSIRKKSTLKRQIRQIP